MQYSTLALLPLCAIVAAIAAPSSLDFGNSTYTPGTCSFDVDEYQNCNDNDNNLYASITLYDNDKHIIYETPGNSLGLPINAGDGATFQGPLPRPIQITGEHENDYIQFTYGSVSWTSRTTSGPATCSNGGWNPRGGPSCLGSLAPTSNIAENQIDCSFPC